MQKQKQKSERGHACVWLFAKAPFCPLSYAPGIFCGVEVVISVK